MYDYVFAKCTFIHSSLAFHPGMSEKELWSQFGTQYQLAEQHSLEVKLLG